MEIRAHNNVSKFYDRFVEEFILSKALPPHNRRKYYLLAREDLQDILETLIKYPLYPKPPLGMSYTQAELRSLISTFSFILDNFSNKNFSIKP